MLDAQKVTTPYGTFYTSLESALALNALAPYGFFNESDELVIYQGDRFCLYLEGNEVFFTVDDDCDRQGSGTRPFVEMKEALRKWRSLPMLDIKLVCDPHKADGYEAERISWFKKLGFQKEGKFMSVCK